MKTISEDHMLMLFSQAKVIEDILGKN